MKLLIYSSLLTVVTLSSSSPISPRDVGEQFTFSQIPTSKNLVWYPCWEVYQCARLQVPLDYKFPNGTQASVPLMKVPAQRNSTDGPYQGLLLSNPGGPGGSGIDAILYSGIETQQIFCTNYDFVSWDPRGIGYAIPLANCSVGQTSVLPRIRRRQLLPALRAPEFDDVLIEETFLAAQEFASVCSEVIGGPTDAGPYMTTAINARDIIRIIDAFAATDDGKRAPDASLLNYYGDSYGTYLGETFASMFPDRVRRLVLDGVTYAEDRATGELTQNLKNADDVLSTFFLYCSLAGSELCPFYTGTTAQDVYNRFENIIFQFDAIRARKDNWANATAISESLEIIKEVLFDPGLYQPIQGFPVLAYRLAAFEAALQNFTVGAIVAASKLNITVNTTPGLVDDLSEGMLGVACSDNRNVYANQTLEDFTPNMLALTNRSVIAGQIWMDNYISCANWTIQSDDVFIGPFGGKTKNPILFVSNTLDPVTTYSNGVAMASIYEGSRLLTVEGTGHTSAGPLNQCAFNIVKTYFQTGALPAGNASYCRLEAGPFGIILTDEQIDELEGMRRR